MLCHEMPLVSPSHICSCPLMSRVWWPENYRIGAAKDQDLFHHPVCAVPGLASLCISANYGL